MIYGMPYEEDKKLEDYFRIDKFTKSTLVSNTALNNRAKNVFTNLGCSTLGDVLRLTIGDLYGAHAMGKGTFEHIVSFFKSIDRPTDDRQHIETTEDKGKRYVAYNILSQHKQQIIDGNFSFLEDINESEEYLYDLVNNYKEAYELVDDELLVQCEESPTYVKSICEMLSSFEIKVKTVNDTLNSIPDYRRARPARNYIDSYTSAEEQKAISLIPDCKDEETLIKYVNRTIENIKTPEYALFLTWCSSDLIQETYALKDQFDRKNRAWDILVRRAHGQTLEQVGESYGITRERIRQIEKKGKIKIAAWENRVKFLELCTADKKDPSLLSKEDMAVFGEAGDVIYYALQDDENISFTYDKNFHVYLSGIDGSLDDEIAYVESMPDTFTEDEFERFFKEGIEHEGVSEEQLKIVLSEEYTLTGRLYHRHRLSMGKICQTIVRKYYPEGIHVHDESEVTRFKKFVNQEFGDVGGSWTLRSMEANIERVCILCGRGIYMAPKDKYISDDLKEKIEEYIDFSDNTIFFINTIYERFKDELKAEGVNNHYFLHGIMKECFGDKYYISRDYVSKDENVGNIREEIVKFVAKSRYPLTMDDIKGAFPGVTDIVLVLSLGDHDVLNFFGSYIHFSQLNLYQHDKIYLRDELDKMVSDNIPHHAKELYEHVNGNNPDLLRRLGIRYEFALFSVVQRLFEGEYQFSRPYIARDDIEITRPEEEIRAFVSGEVIVEIEELMNKCEELHYRLATNRLNFFMSFNDSHLLINKDELKSIDSIGLNEQIAKEIEALVYDEINETIPIADLRCVAQFPKVNVPWTEQLIFSVLYKWSELLEVDSSFNMSYENAVLLVSPKGKMNNNIFEKSGELAKVDDLDNIDALIEDELFKDINF